MVMQVGMREGRKAAVLLSVNTVGRVLLVVLNLTEVEPSFPRIRAGRG